MKSKSHIALLSVLCAGLASASFLAPSGISPFSSNWNVLLDWEGADLNEFIGAADFDQDGYEDLLVRVSDSKLRVLLNQSGTGFIPSSGVENNNFNFSRYVGIADVNGDGFPDIVLSGQPAGGEPGNGIRVWLNQIPNNPVCASDLDKTGNVDFSDLLFVLNEWGECGQQIN